MSSQRAVEQTLIELQASIQKNVTVVVDQLDSLLSLLLSCLDKEADPVIILYSLRVIKTLADLPKTIVFKHTSTVVRGLLPVLDSKQRVIREYAARVRNLWLMIHYTCFLNKHWIFLLAELVSLYRRHLQEHLDRFHAIHNQVLPNSVNQSHHLKMFPL